MMNHEIYNFEQKCREHDLKVTHQRLEIFKALSKVKDHPSVDEIYKKVVKKIPTISLDTVYRTLETFSNFGIIKKFQAHDGKFHFDSNFEEHQHLICDRCGKIEDYIWEEISQVKVPSKSGWKNLKVTAIEIHGLCSDCK